MKEISSEACQEFSAFPQALEVCATCGQLAERHRVAALPEANDLTKALWKVLLDRGGVWSFYGGGFIPAHIQRATRGQAAYYNEMAQIKFHLETCEIDWRRTRAPEMDQWVYEFAGTDHESTPTTQLCGSLYCKCGMVGRYPLSDKIGMNDVTLGQLIWLAVHADDEEK